MRVLVFGKGWLGGALRDGLGGVTAACCDIGNPALVAKDIEAHKPDVVINAAGKCGNPNVDWCDWTDDNRRLSYLANAVGPSVVERVCKDLGVQALLHLSSGCVWKSGENIAEDTPPEPPSYYSMTKLVGEQSLDPAYSLILRLRMPFNADLGQKRNFLAKILKYKEVITDPQSVVYVPDLVAAAKALLEAGRTGIYNVANTGAVSPAEVVGMYRDIVDATHAFTAIGGSKELLGRGLVTSPRASLTLGLEKLAKAGIVLPPAAERMRLVMNEIAGARHG